MLGVHWNRARASELRGVSVYVRTMTWPLSPSRVPSYFTAGVPGGFARRVGMVTERKTWLLTAVSVNVKPFSWSSTAPVPSTTWKVTFWKTPAAVAPASTTVATRSSEHEYWYLSSLALLAGRLCAVRPPPIEVAQDCG